MPAGSPRGRQGRAYRREEIERLLHQALTELMANGTTFSELSVDRLLSPVGIARSTFYVYFDDKSAMLQALSAASLRRLYDAQRSWIVRGREVTRADVVDGMRQLLTLFLEDEAVIRAVAEASGYDAAIRTAYVQGVEGFAGRIERFIRKGQKEGWVAVEPHPAATAAALAWMTERTVTQVAPGASSRKIDQTAEALATIVWSTMFGVRALSPGQRTSCPGIVHRGYEEGLVFVRAEVAGELPTRLDAMPETLQTAVDACEQASGR